MGACENVLNSLGRSRNLPRTYDIYAEIGKKQPEE